MGFWLYKYKIIVSTIFHNIWIIWDKDGGSLRVRVRIVWVRVRGGVIISVEIFTLKYCSSVRIYVCRKGFQLVLYITAWVFGVAGWECIYVACVLFELWKREKDREKGKEIINLYACIMCGEKKEASKLCIQLYGERKRKRQGARERWKGCIKICSWMCVVGDLKKRRRKFPLKHTKKRE